MLIALPVLPVLTAVFGGFFFNRLPKHAAKVTFLFHVVGYSLFLLLFSSKVHYLYCVAVICPLELRLLYILHRRNKHGEVYVQQDVGAVDLTPWKYRHVVSIVALVCVGIVYYIFSPLGIAG